MLDVETETRAPVEYKQSLEKVKCHSHKISTCLKFVKSLGIEMFTVNCLRHVRKKRH